MKLSILKYYILVLAIGILVSTKSSSQHLSEVKINELTTEEKRLWVQDNYDVELVAAEPTQTDVIATQLNKFANLFDTPLNVSKEEISARYREYHSLVNMTYKELQTWGESDCCKALGYSKQPIQRNLHLLNTNKNEWGSKEYRIAGQIISAINRLLDFETDAVVINGETECGNKRDLALKNQGQTS